MIVLYNVCQLAILLFTWPILVLLILGTAKYRQGIPNRLGIGLGKRLRACQSSQKTVWIHALSVGEVSSAYPLVAGLRKQSPDIRIVFSIATRSGLEMATTLLAPIVDCVIPSPLDLQPTVNHYIRRIQPDLYILIETDFWPNLLHTLRRKKIPTILVNGRISRKSLSGYERLAFFFRPLFQSFSHLCMQTETDRDNMTRFAVEPNTLHCLGNLKFDTSIWSSPSDLHELSHYIPPQSRIFLSGSTHEGEENIILGVYATLKNSFSDLFLIIAPRDPKRREEISRLATACSLSWNYRSELHQEASDLIILDTLGELQGLYELADIAFVGGSLVNEGGHNPIEPASAGVPVLFGPHMEDFSEISRDLLQAGGALIVTGQTSLLQSLTTLLSSNEQRKKMGERARSCVDRQRGVVDRHLAIIRTFV